MIGETVYSAAHREVTVGAREQAAVYMYGRLQDGQPAHLADFATGATIYSRPMSDRLRPWLRQSASAHATDRSYLWIAAHSTNKLIWIQGRYLTRLTPAQSEKIPRRASETDPECWQMAMPGDTQSSISSF